MSPDYFLGKKKSTERKSSKKIAENRPRKTVRKYRDKALDPRRAGVFPVGGVAEPWAAAP